MVLFTDLPHAIHAHFKSFFVIIDVDRSYPKQNIKHALSSHYGRYINLHRFTYNLYQRPYSDCSVLKDNTLLASLDDRSVFDLVVATGYPYTREICNMICRQVLVTRTCGCDSYYIEYQLENFDVCDQEDNTLNLGGCMTQMKANFTFTTEYCFPRCPLECHKSFFNKAFTQYTYDKNYFNRFLNSFRFKDDVPKGTDLVDYLNDNMVEVRINYDTDAYVEISEEPKMTGEELLGQLGGNLHLFLGMSLLSFVELFELLRCFF